MINHQEELARQLSESLTTEDLVHLKVWGFAGAGVSLAMILLIAQIAKPMPYLEPDLRVALHCSAVALPIWFFYGLSFSFWLAFKLTFVDLHASTKRKAALFVGPCLALCLNVIAVFFILRHFHDMSSGLFVISAGVGFVFFCALLFGAGKILWEKYWQRVAASSNTR